MSDLNGTAIILEADSAKKLSDTTEIKGQESRRRSGNVLTNVNRETGSLISRQLTRPPITTAVPKKTPAQSSEKILSGLETCGIFEPYLKKDADVLHEYVNNYNNCLLRNIDYVKNDMDKFINQHKKNNDKINSIEQINNDTMKTYIKDYYYVILKGIVYLTTLAIFIYLFGINNLIEGIKVTGTVIKDKAIILKDKAIILKDKAEEIKNKIVS
jgi:hypothetical protein